MRAATIAREMLPAEVVPTNGDVPAADAKTMRVGVVSTYPPRICGIGTFSRDLREALLGVDGVWAVDIAAIVRDDEVEAAGEVVARIHQDQRGRLRRGGRTLRPARAALHL